MLAGGKGAGTAGRGRPRQPVSGPQESPLPNSQTTTRLPSCAMYTVKCCLQARDSEIYLRMTGGAARRCRQQHMGTNLTCAGRVPTVNSALPGGRRELSPAENDANGCLLHSLSKVNGWFHCT